jgi:hypothetical protein
VHRLVADQSLIPDLDPQRVEEHQRVDRLERPGLPGRDLLQHRIGDGADQVRRDLDAVQIAQMPRDLARAHAPRVHRDDLLIEAGETPLVLGNQLRVEGGLPIPRDRELDPPGVGQHRLAAVAVAAVAALAR